MFEWSAAVDDFRCWETVDLEARRTALMGEQRRIEVEILAVTRVLDERGRIDDALAARDGVTVRDLRDQVRTAEALDGLPGIASAAADGMLSGAQVREVTKIADPDSDAEWADRAPTMSPTDLAKEARRLQTPTVDDTRRRHDARSLKMWWGKSSGMLEGKFALPDLQGAAFESVIQQLTEKMSPAKGQAWERWDRRAADALVALVDRWSGVEGTVADGVKPKVVVNVPVNGPAEVADGILLGVEQVEQLRANATVEVAVVDDDGSVIGISRAVNPLTPKVRLAILARYGKCRWPGCETRWGLEVHHLVPRSHGGSDEFTNLAAVCAMHHRRLVPHGTWVLAGNPNRPDGLTLHRCSGDRGGQRPHDHPNPPVTQPSRSTRPRHTPSRARTRAGPAG